MRTDRRWGSWAVTLDRLLAIFKHFHCRSRGARKFRSKTCQKLFDFTDSVPLDQIGLMDKALNQENGAINSYGGLRTIARLGPTF